MSDERDIIRSRVSIIDLVQQTVRLQKRGKNWTGLCPFHDDKNPSMTVSEGTGTYKCWSCGARGDIFTWVMETQKVEFREALSILAKTAGVELSDRPAGESSKRGTYQGLMDATHEFFMGQLRKNSSAMEYCLRRGIDEATQKTWELGFAPLDDTALPRFLKEKGFTLADGKELFVVDGDDSRGYGSKFKNRIMFPIRNERGQLVAFGGRIIGDGQPKYINSSDTPLYSKRRVLYGMERAKDHIAKADRTILTEGYLDVIACHRAGLPIAVASLGTALSEDHAKLMRRWAKRVTILYDGDSAGQKAAERAAEMLEAEDLEVDVVLLEQGHDPDTLLQTVGPPAVLRAAEGGLTPLDYRVARLRKEIEPSQRGFWEALVPLLAKATPLDQERVSIELAPMYPGIRDPAGAKQALLRQIREHQLAQLQQNRGQERSRQGRPRYTKFDITGPERVILRGFGGSAFRRQAWSAISNLSLFVSEAAFLYAQMIRDAFPDNPPEGSPPEWLGALEPEDLRFQFADFLNGVEEPIDEDILRGAVEDLEKRLQKRELTASRREMVPGDDDALAEIGRRLRKLKGEAVD